MKAYIVSLLKDRIKMTQLFVLFFEHKQSEWLISNFKNYIDLKYCVSYVYKLFYPALTDKVIIKLTDRITIA